MDQFEAASIRDAVTRRLNDYVEASLSLDAEKCLDCFAGMEEPVMASDAAVCSTEFEWSFGLDSGEHLRSQGAWTDVFKRIGETWRIVHSGGAHVFLPGAEPPNPG